MSTTSTAGTSPVPPLPPIYSQSSLSNHHHGEIDGLEVVDVVFSGSSVFSGARIPTTDQLCGFVMRRGYPLPEHIASVERFDAPAGTVYRLRVRPTTTITEDHDDATATGSADADQSSGGDRPPADADRRVGNDDDGVRPRGAVEGGPDRPQMDLWGLTDPTAGGDEAGETARSSLAASALNDPEGTAYIALFVGAILIALMGFLGSGELSRSADPAPRSIYAPRAPTIHWDGPIGSTVLHSQRVP